MFNKGIFYGIAAGIVLVIGFFVIFSGPGIEAPAPNGPAETNWIAYENDAFGFKIMHPSDWVVHEAPDNEIMPAFNIYPASYESSLTPRDLPLIHHSDTPNVSIFPNGVPTEGVFGDTVESNVEFTEKPERAIDFVLENGDRWATFAGFSNGPDLWESFGFVWAKAEINNYSAVCVRDGKERPVESCDFLGSDDKIIHRGAVDGKMRAIQVRILESFEFRDR